MSSNKDFKLSISNKRIWDFYNNNKNINFEAVNLIFLDLIEDVDLLSGWNSSFFDISYLVLRIEKVLGSRYLEKILTS